MSELLPHEQRRSLERLFPLPPCPYRRVRHGQLFCEISTDPRASHINDLVCFNCPVPQILEKNDCIFLSLGTQVRFFQPNEPLVVEIACLAKNRLITLEDCVGCPLHHPRPPAEKATPLTAPPRPRSGLLQQLGCPEDWQENLTQVAVALADHPAADALWEDLYAPLLREAYHRIPVRLKGEDLCADVRAILESWATLVDLYTPHPRLLLYTGMALALGKPVRIFAPRHLPLESSWKILPLSYYGDLEDLRHQITETLDRWSKEG